MPCDQEGKIRSFHLKKEVLKTDHCMYVHSCWEWRADELRVLNGATERSGSSCAAHGWRGREGPRCSLRCASRPRPSWLLGSAAGFCVPLQMAAVVAAGHNKAGACCAGPLPWAAAGPPSFRGGAAASARGATANRCREPAVCTRSRP